MTRQPIRIRVRREMKILQNIIILVNISNRNFYYERDDVSHLRGFLEIYEWKSSCIDE